MSPVLPLFIAFILTANPAYGGAPSSRMSDKQIERGMKIYEDGVLISGEPLMGKRLDGMLVSGKDAACILCHRRSGMGMAEGAYLVPAITGPALFENFRQPGHRTRVAQGISLNDRPSFSRPAYNDASLAQALRDGISPSGHRFHYLMPRYRLGNADMAALSAYLRNLSATSSPGANPKTTHFATVIAPDQNPSHRDQMIKVLRTCLEERQPPGQEWRLNVWDMKGAVEAWGSQLAVFYAQQNVFAMVSGMGTDEWGPVHQFCEDENIPCLFANTDIPGNTDESSYNFYFNKGLMLEAEVIGSHIVEAIKRKRLQGIIQVYTDKLGEKVAKALEKTLAEKSSDLKIQSRKIDPNSAASIEQSLQGLQPTDALILWMSNETLTRLVSYMPEPPKVAMTIISGILIKGEIPRLNQPWRTQAQIVYPYDAPGRWAVRMNFNLRPWLNEQGIEALDERLLGNTLAACNLLSESMLRLRGVLSRDYLVELIENYPVSMGNAPAPQAFPRFSLGPGQRFSSKGAYILGFLSPYESQVEPLHDWIVP